MLLQKIKLTMRRPVRLNLQIELEQSHPIEIEGMIIGAVTVTGGKRRESLIDWKENENAKEQGERGRET